MKPYALLATILVLASLSTRAQVSDEFWGTTSEGGVDNAGTIFSTDNTGGNVTVRHSFRYLTPGALVSGTKFTEFGGKLYGIARTGGKAGAVLISYEPATATITELHDFELPTGSMPMAEMVVFNGKLYGTTFVGGTANPNDIAGTIFEFDPATNIYTKKKTFTFWDGTRPTTALTPFNGKLWGTTSAGSMNNAGTIFEYDPVTNVYAVKDTFMNAVATQASSLTPYGGKLYGACAAGGAGGSGGVFSYDPAVPNSLTVLAPFSNTTGTTATALVVVDTLLFGTAAYGGTNSRGTIFSFSPATNLITKHHDFATGDGQNPVTSLTLADGALWGTTSSGGATVASFATAGVLYKWNPVTSTFTKMRDFTFSTTNQAIAPDGRTPTTPVTFHNGRLWGCTEAGGAGLMGVLYSYEISTATYTKEKDMSMTAGSAPKGNLLYHNGKFYGYTDAGGAGGVGTIFSFDPLTNTHTILYDGTYGSVHNLEGAPVVKNNILYGCADGYLYNGNVTQNYGALFSLDLSTNALTAYPMQPSTTGWDPTGRLVEMPNGLFLGINTSGVPGSLSDGTLFTFNPTTGTITKVQNFSLADGRFPNGIMAYNGKYYITFEGGGNSSAGSIMEYTPGLNAVERGTLVQNTTGRGAAGELVPYNGKLWGMASYDGPSPFFGTIYEFNPASPYTITKKYSHTLTGGINPTGTLLLYNNKFYGLTGQGGANGYNGVGVLFEYDPAAGVYTKKADFNFTNGARPYGGLVAAPTGSTPLAIEALNFSAEAVRGNAVLRWRCADENVVRYGVERSADAAVFEVLGSTIGAASDDCSFVDATPNAGKNFYRLRLEERSGGVAHSAVQRLDFLEGKVSARLLNTAAVDGKIGVEATVGGELRMVSAMGAEVLRTRLRTGVEWIDVSGLAAGVYGVVVGGVWVGRFAVGR